MIVVSFFPEFLDKMVEFLPSPRRDGFDFKRGKGDNVVNSSFWM